MAKKTTKSVSEDSCPTSYEKLRDEVFQYRIETRSQLKSFRYLASFTAIVVAILAFFGYDKIDSITSKIEERTNSRLASTDSLLSSIDTQYLDSLTIAVSQRTAIYEKALTELERGTKVSQDYFRVVGNSLPYNKEIEVKIDSYLNDNRIDVIDVVQFSGTIHERQVGDCIVSIRDDVDIKEGDAIEIKVYPKGRRIVVFSQFYHVNKPLNRLSFRITRFEDYQDYSLFITLYSLINGQYHAYVVEEPLKLE